MKKPTILRPTSSEPIDLRDSAAALPGTAHCNHLSDVFSEAMDDARKNANVLPHVRPVCPSRVTLVVRNSATSSWLSRLSGHSQQINDVSFGFERPRIGLYEAMIDRNLADLVKLVFADADIGKAGR